MKKLDLRNRRFGKLSALMPWEQSGVKVKWICQCDCGNFCKVVSNKLTSGYTKSCGCLRVKHGHSRKMSDAQVLSHIMRGFAKMKPVSMGAYG